MNSTATVTLTEQERREYLRTLKWKRSPWLIALGIGILVASIVLWVLAFTLFKGNTGLKIGMIFLAAILTGTGGFLTLLGFGNEHEK